MPSSAPGSTPPPCPRASGCSASGAPCFFPTASPSTCRPGDFGRLLGVYVTLFFVVAQLINRLGFGLKPTPAILVGGGMTIAFWRA